MNKVLVASGCLILGEVIVPKVVVISLLAPTLLDVAESSNFGNAEGPVEDGGNPKVLFGLGSATTVEPVVELIVDKG